MTFSAYNESSHRWPYRSMSYYDITRVVQNFSTPLLVLSSISVPSLAALLRL
jgi:hypothetical protein